jgi:methionyl-tRNA synthetase
VLVELKVSIFTEYLQYENEKFSKSRGVGVFGNNVSESSIPVDVWRYYLLGNRPETADAQFSWGPFIAANNSELLANLGNFVNRIMKFTASLYGSVVPEYKLDGPMEVKLIQEVNALLTQYIESLDHSKSLRAGLRLVMDISSLGNKYIQDNNVDKKLFENSRERCDTVVAVTLNLVYLVSALVTPYLPKTGESIARQLNAPTRRITDVWNANDILPGHTIGKAEYLFSRIEEKRADELRAKYSGGQKGTDAKADKNAKKAAKKDKAKSAGSALLNEAPANVEKTESIVKLEAEIKEKGDLVRKLKVDKAAADEVTKAVEELMEAKKALTKEVETLLQKLTLN